MKNQSKIYKIIFSIFLLSIFISCDKGNDVPSITITGVTNITGTTATIGVNITSDGGAYITARGICWGLNPNPTIEGSYSTAGNGTGTFSATISNLMTQRTYYVRAWAMNREGIGYSPQVTFETMLGDYDGNVYHTVTIGTQVWMVENLRTLHYTNGDPIPLVASGSVWINGIEGGCCVYDNDDANSGTYGLLYNAYTIFDSNSRSIAPSGWHVATNADYETLETYLGGTATAGGKMKESGTTHWNSPNAGADNTSGFTALPGGFRGEPDGIFSGLGDKAYFWTSTAQSADSVYCRILDTNSAKSTVASAPKFVGMSVRCVKN